MFDKNYGTRKSIENMEQLYVRFCELIYVWKPSYEDSYARMLHENGPSSLSITCCQCRNLNLTSSLAGTLPSSHNASAITDSCSSTATCWSNSSPCMMRVSSEVFMAGRSLSRTATQNCGVVHCMNWRDWMSSTSISSWSPSPPGWRSELGNMEDYPYVPVRRVFN